MYRYSVDNAVTYTPNDFVLFRESPFAVWMERLTLENPEHGIPPDHGSHPPIDDITPQDDMVDTLREEGRDVVLVNWDQDEPRRRADTLDAMRSGADFIVNGMLALGPLSGNVNLLMRTSGYSDFGDFLYVPCDTQMQSKLHSAFRLCFLADLLHSLQGQLPPQMLVIRGDADVMPLQTEDHIYYYRAVKQRFMNAMRTFRKHKMPDPSESAHFGRWSDCASEVLKQRVLSNGADDIQDEFEEIDELLESESEQSAPDLALQDAQETSAQVAQANGAAVVEMSASSPTLLARAEALRVSAPRTDAVPTLAEQASQITPDTYAAASAPGQTPNLARFPRLVPDPPQGESKNDDEGACGEDQAAQNVAKPEAAAEPASDELEDALQNLAFIGSSRPAPMYDSQELTRHPETEDEAIAEGESASNADAALDTFVQAPATEAPAPTLREIFPEPRIEGYEVELIDAADFDMEPREPHLLPPDVVIAKPEPAVSVAVEKDNTVSGFDDGLVDLDSAPPPTLMPLTTSGIKPVDEDFQSAEAAEKTAARKIREEAMKPLPPRFSSSLITNKEDFDDSP